MKNIFVFLITLISINVNAAWIDTTGTIVNLVTYAHTNTILVTLSKNGIDVEECSNKITFAVSRSIESESRSRMYAMLLAAQASGREVTVTYNDAGGCEPWDANPSGYRQIVRLK